MEKNLLTKTQIITSRVLYRIFITYAPIIGAGYGFLENVKLM